MANKFVQWMDERIPMTKDVEYPPCSVPRAEKLQHVVHLWCARHVGIS